MGGLTLTRSLTAHFGNEVYKMKTFSIQTHLIVVMVSLVVYLLLASSVSILAGLVLIVMFPTLVFRFVCVVLRWMVKQSPTT